MPTNLTDNNIDETFGGLIHAQGAALPTTGKIDLYDGVGNKSSLQIGRSGKGATIYAGVNEDSFTVLGDLSASGRAVIGHMEALSGSTAPNITKAFVSFWGNTSEPLLNMVFHQYKEQMQANIQYISHQKQQAC